MPANATSRLLAAGLMMNTSVAMAHDWYPRSCCEERDCGPVLSATRSSKGIWATTANGTVFVPDTFEWETSPDGRMHVCVRRDFTDPTKLVVLCAFRGPGL